MKLAPSLALGAALAALSLPAAAQRLGQEKPKDARPDMEEKSTKSTTTTKTSSATDSTGRKRDISKGAQAAIVALQTAVNANDAANIPARLAAAQAVANSGSGYGPYGAGAYGAYGYGYQPDLTFKCDVDYRGYVRDIDIMRR